MLAQDTLPLLRSNPAPETHRQASPAFVSIHWQTIAAGVKPTGSTTKQDVTARGKGYSQQ